MIERHSRFHAAFLAIVAITIVVPAHTEDLHLGQIEYEIACLSCHGALGRGDGPEAAQLGSIPPDLTQISKRNGGEFPFVYVARVIDGRAGISGHQKREMPIWGDRYRKAIEDDEPLSEIDTRARHRIRALVLYLQSIQAPTP